MFTLFTLERRSCGWGDVR